MQKELEVVSVCSGLEHRLVCCLSPRGRSVVEKRKYVRCSCYKDSQQRV